MILLNNKLAVKEPTVINYNNTICYYGDSNTVAYNLPAGKGYASVCSSLLEATEVNQGVSQTCMIPLGAYATSSGYSRRANIKSSQFLTRILVILFGTNDASLVDGTPELFYQYYCALLDDLILYGYTTHNIVIVGIPYCSDATLRTRTRLFDDMSRRVAAKYNITYVPTFDEGNNMVVAQTTDTVHLSETYANIVGTKLANTIIHKL